MSLAVRLLPNLAFADPLMIASSHLTANKKAFTQLAVIRPSAVTLKTTSALQGGDGEGKRERLRLYDASERCFGFYADGERTAEFWDVPTTYRYTQDARDVLPDTILGLSVLHESHMPTERQRDTYMTTKKQLDLSMYGYVEFNLKYAVRTLRADAVKECLDGIYNDVRAFLDVFSELPVLVKLPREIGPLLGVDKCREIVQTIGRKRAGIIVANSKRIRVPPSRTKTSTPKELSSGVVMGEYLFIETYEIIRRIKELGLPADEMPPVVASGGVYDLAGILDLMATGTEVVQLCTLLDIRGPEVVALLRQQLEALREEFGSLSRLCEETRTDPAQWSRMVLVARDIQASEQGVVEKVFGKPDPVMALIGEALQSECGGVVVPTSSDDGSASIPDSFRFVLTRSTASGLLLGHRCVMSLGFEPFTVETSGDFVRSLEEKGFTYDFAILPESCVKFIAKQRRGIPESNRPVEVGHVANALFELVGRVPRELRSVERIYYFGGVSSREALGGLLTAVGELQAEERPEAEVVQPSRLLPLLRFWKDGRAILGKPPLSRIYGMCGRQDLAKSWGPIWTWKDRTLLVARKERMEDPGFQAVARAVLRRIDAERARIVESPEKAAQQLRSMGFLTYCASLLTPKTS